MINLTTGFCRTLLLNTLKAFNSSTSCKYHILHRIGGSGHTAIANSMASPMEGRWANGSFGMSNGGLLLPSSVLLEQMAGFKMKMNLRKRCKDCYFVVRQQRYYIICPTHRRHKQKQIKPPEKNSWILTHATQSKKRPY